MLGIEEGGSANPNLFLSISSSWANLRLHTETQLSKLS
jgi:hypothetical protein